jgi:hypothetical protein
MLRPMSEVDKLSLAFSLDLEKLMKKLLTIFLLLLSLTITNAQSKRIGIFRFEKKKGSHEVKVIVRTRPFDSSKHKVAYVEKMGNTVDGRRAYGAETVPEAEIDAIEFLFDGKKIRIPKSLYADCYDPDLHDNPLTIRFSRDFQSASVSMSGSDGAGGYRVVWILRKTGHHSRFFKETF